MGIIGMDCLVKYRPGRDLRLLYEMTCTKLSCTTKISRYGSRNFTSIYSELTRAEEDIQYSIDTSIQGYPVLEVGA